MGDIITEKNISLNLPSGGSINDILYRNMNDTTLGSQEIPESDEIASMHDSRCHIENVCVWSLACSWC